jgi:predicted phage-related endonuclease
VIVSSVVPNSPEWFAWRRDGVGGSDLPILLGVSRYEDASVLSLALDKLGLTYPAENGLSNDWRKRRGQLLEPLARRCLEEHVQCPTYSRCGHVKGVPHHRVSLDSWWRVKRSKRIAELKALKHEIHLQFAAVVDGRAEVSSLPADLLVQCQWQLYVSGAEWCYLANYSEKKGEDRQFHKVKLHPEPAFWDSHLIPAADKFWGLVKWLKAAFPGGMAIEDVAAAVAEDYPTESEAA